MSRIEQALRRANRGSHLGDTPTLGVDDVTFDNEGTLDCDGLDLDGVQLDPSPVASVAAGAAPRPSPADPGSQTELQAMVALNEILAGLRDSEARRRVLQWAARECQAGDVLPARSEGRATPRSGQRGGDPLLAVDNLDSLFDDAPSPHRAAAAATSPSPEPVSSMLRSFVEEFQQLARDWGSVDDAE